MKKLLFTLILLLSFNAHAQYKTVYVQPQYVGQTYVIQQPIQQPQQIYIQEVERPVYIKDSSSEALALGVGALVGGIIGYSIDRHHYHHGHHYRPPMPPPHWHYGGFRPLYFPRR